MDNDKIMTTLRSIGRGYIDIIKKMLLFLLVLAGITGISFAIVLPLWYLATYAETAFTLLALLGSAAALLFFIGRGIYRRVTDSAYKEENEENPLKKILFVTGKSLLLIVLVYIILLFYMRGTLFIAIPLTVITLGIVGYFAYGKRHRKSA